MSISGFGLPLSWERGGVMIDEFNRAKIPLC